MEACRIAILDPDVVNQIAAGEVVERPASVVKELIENALDAGARRIDVEAAQGGQGLVRVADDGCGMTAEEARLSLERHATSKLRQTDDLLSIRSMGFRGEALPSVASVSQLLLTTRTAGEDMGVMLRVRGGTREADEPVGCRPGTVIEVRQLFFNTPARLKFLKSTATETAQINETVSRLALANPTVHFTLCIDERRVLDLPAHGDRLQRASAVFPGKGGPLLSTQHQGGAGLAVSACLGDPGQSVRSARSVHLFVNRRAVRDRALAQAVVAGYDALLERGRFPLAVVHIDIDPAAVDVNVHPQKVEVRFAEPDRIFAAVRRCVRDKAAQGGWAKQGRVYRLNPVAAPPESGGARAAAAGAGYGEHRARIAEATRRFWSASIESPLSSVALETPTAATSREAPAPYVAASPERADRGLRYLGQVLGTYLVLESADELVLVDQHAAHERVSFARLRRAMQEQGRVPAQRLLVPCQIELDAALAAVATERTAALEQLGLELEPFGGNAWTVRAVPGWLAGADPAQLVRDVLEELNECGTSGAITERYEAVLARMACHGSVRAGRAMEPEEVTALLAALERVDFAGACPHGRPVELRLSRAELEQRFGR